MSNEDKPIKFKTSTLKVGNVTIYAKIDPVIVKHLNLTTKQEGIATIVDRKIILDFTK